MLFVICTKSHGNFGTRGSMIRLHIYVEKVVRRNFFKRNPWTLPLDGETAGPVVWASTMEILCLPALRAMLPVAGWTMLPTEPQTWGSGAGLAAITFESIWRRAWPFDVNKKV
jgi:hypothetical protein